MNDMLIRSSTKVAAPTFNIICFFLIFLLDAYLKFFVSYLWCKDLKNGDNTVALFIGIRQHQTEISFRDWVSKIHQLYSLQSWHYSRHENISFLHSWFWNQNLGKIDHNNIVDTICAVIKKFSIIDKIKYIVQLLVDGCLYCSVNLHLNWVYDSIRNPKIIHNFK